MKVQNTERAQTRETDVLAKVARQGFNEDDLVLLFCKSPSEGTTCKFRRNDF